MAKEKDGVFPSARVRPDANWTLDVHHDDGSRLDGPQAEIDKAAAEAWRVFEPDFLDLLHRFEATSGYVSVSTSWKPLVAT